MDLNDLNKVWEIKQLKKLGEQEAKKILENVAKQVQPIMRKRKWKVKLLSEFCPANPSLLGLNIGGGAEIRIRLRKQNQEWDFLPYVQILDTMLHELCHNEHGPHNADFYKLLEEIRKECEDLMAKGITGTGQGFDLPGKRLGGAVAYNPSLSSRQNSLAAAENRARNKDLMPSGPKRIGGDNNIMASLSPIQAAAMAAERRYYDDLWCGSKSLQAGDEETIGSSEITNVSVLPSEKHVETLPSSSSNPHDVTVNNQESWPCSTCTLLNKPVSLTCEACGSQKLRSQKLKAVAKFKGWSCKFCTLDNSVKTERCIACGEWRYSFGQPTSAGAPYLGT